MGLSLETTTNKKIAVIGLGVNFEKNIEGILNIFRNKKILYVDKNLKAGNSFVRPVSHEEFIALEDFNEFEIVLTSYNFDELIKKYEKYGNAIYILKYNNNYNSINNIIKFEKHKINNFEEPIFKDNKNIFITGTTSGIGYELAKFLTQENYKVYGLSKSNENIFNENYYHIKKDLNQIDGFVNVVDQLPKNLNSIYLNAGVSLFADNYLNINADQIEKIFRVNTISNMLLLNKLIENNNIGKDTSIVYTKTSLTGSINEAVYSSSKMAFEKYIDEYSISNLSYKNIYKIDPGWLKTKMGTDKAPNSVAAIYPVFLLPLLDNVERKTITINALDFYRNSLSECFKKLKFIAII